MDPRQKALYLMARNLRFQSEILRRQADVKRKTAEFYRRKAKMLLILLSGCFEKQRERNVWAKKRTSKFWEVEVQQYTDEEFKNNFRLSRSTFSFLVNSLSCLERTDTNMRKCISIDKRIAIALYAIGSLKEYNAVANLFGVGRTTVGEIVIEVCEAVWKKMQQDFLNLFPPTQNKINDIVTGFEKKSGFPQCFRAVDGCHIEVRIPKEHDVDYYKAFKQLKARFPKIGKGFKTSIANARKIIKACCVLHNICNELDDPIHQDWRQEGSQGDDQPNTRTAVENNDIIGNVIRTALCNYFNDQKEMEVK